MIIFKKISAVVLVAGILAFTVPPAIGNAPAE